VDGRYRLLERLGSGSMGVVFRAEDVFLERVVAIKLIDPSNANDEKTVERFMKEARALALIRHQNVVQVYAFGPHQGSYYFAMEYVSGESLESVIDAHVTRGETVPFERAMEIVRAIGAGLQAVHDRKLVHRDVKPSNVVLEHETGRPLIIDFGLARRRSASNPRLSIAGGTPMYMAPEQARDPDGKGVTVRADVYAFAATIFELLTGRCVFDGGDIYDVMVQHLTAPPPRISSRLPALAPLDAALVRALAKDPAHRFESVTDFVAALDAGAKKIALDSLTSTTSKMRPMVGPVERVLLLVADDGLRRRITKLVDRSLEEAFRTPAVETANDAEEAWEALRREPAGIVVIDADASGAPIEQLVANVRRLPGAKSTSVLVLSRDWETLRVSLAPHGVKDVVPKPLNVQILTSALTRILVRRSSPEL
jgi:serine/threonine-protein kinase